MSAWGKVNGIKGDSKILFMSDTKSFFSKNHGWSAGVGDRNGRWAMVIEKDGTVSYSAVEPGPGGITVRRLEFVLRTRLIFLLGLWSRVGPFQIVGDLHRLLAEALKFRKTSYIQLMHNNVLVSAAPL